jgi:O-antigen/teichoic acid export membrane protein
VELIGTLCQSIICLVFALQGYGVWALVLGTISMHLVFIVGYNLASRNFVFPKIKLNGMKSIMTFGGFMTGSNLLWYYYIKADVLISGYFLDSKLIGNFSVAKAIASLPMEKIFPIITQVALHAYSKIQSEYDQIQRYFLKSLRLASLTIMPIFFGLFVIVPEFVEFVLGNKWS